ncbi:hypothetical protein RND81_03G189600 [Saponaria officinalis]|uniref:BZIP domain-containing protein n=1 Tax=Saponaria officinalis TaxID=3572 RepID=A0AAW1MAN1_SAPOF
MATSSGNTTATTISSSTSIENEQVTVIIDEKKRKRMTSNRESARRSRVKKQQHVDDLTAEIARFRRENDQVGQTINLTGQQFMNVEFENSVLRAQMSELSQRLDSLNGIVNDINTLNGVRLFEDNMGDFRIMNGYFGNFTENICNDPWNLGLLEPTHHVLIFNSKERVIWELCPIITLPFST